MGRFCLLVELRWEGSAPAACAAGLFLLNPSLIGIQFLFPVKSNRYLADVLRDPIEGEARLVGHDVKILTDSLTAVRGSSNF